MKTYLRHIALFIGLAASLAFCPPEYATATVTNTTVSTTTAYGDGSTTTFSIGFAFLSNSWINVVLWDTSTVPPTSTTIIQGSGASKYTVSGGNPGTSVVMGTAPTTTQYLVITRNIPLTQTTAFSPAGVFPYQGLSNQLDQVTMTLQNLNAGIGGGSGGGGGGGGSSSLPPAQPYNLWGWDSTGAIATAYPGSTVTLSANDILQYNGTGWTNYNLTGSGIASLINSYSTNPISAAAGGTGVVNSGSSSLNLGTYAITFNTSGTTTLTLPTTGTVVTGTTATGNTPGDIVLRDGSGNFSAGTVTASSFVGPVTGAVTGNVTGNVAGTATNVTGVVAIGNGGTGQTTQAAALTALTGTQTSGQYARSDGTNTYLNSIVAADLPTIPWTKMAQQTHNSLLWSDNSGNEGVIPTNVNTGYVLTSNGVSPFWSPQGSGIPGILPYGIDTGSANAYVLLTTNPPIASYGAGIGVSFIATNANTGASTINVTALGAVALTEPDGGALVAGDILANQMVMAMYDGTQFQMVSPQGPAVTPNTANTMVKRNASGNFSAGTITANLTGTASNASQGSTVAVSNSASYFPAFFASSTNGSQPFNLGTGLTFNPSTNNLATTTFTGALAGNATTATSATNLLGGANGSLPYQTGSGATSFLAAGSNTNLLTLASGIPAWEAIPTWNQSTTGNALTSTTATNLAGGLGGSIPYQSAAGTTAMLPNGSATFVLTSNGTTLAPTWTAPGAVSPLNTKGDIYTYTSTNARHAVPGDYGAMYADSSQADGYRNVSYSQVGNNPKTKNLIQYYDFENDATTGWSLGTIGTLTNGIPTGTPTFGSGASANLSIAATSTSGTSFGGAYYLGYISSAATTVGNMLAGQAITVPANATTYTVSFDYSAISGAANMNMSGSSSNSYGVAVYDVTNSTFLSMVGNFCTIQISQVGTCNGASFQTNATTASIRPIVYNVTATAGAATLGLKNFLISPVVYNQGYAGSDSVAYNPTFTGFGTVTTWTASSHRVGDYLDGIVTFSSATPTGVTAQVSLGYNGGNSNVTIDGSKLTATQQAVGHWYRSGTTTAEYNNSVLATGNTSYLTFSVTNGTTSALSPQLGNVLVGSTEGISFYYHVPIVGWSSNTATSADSSPMPTTFSVNTSTTAASSAQPLIYSNVTDDSCGGYNASTGQYKICSSGKYVFDSTYFFGSNTITAGLYLGGVQLTQGTQTVSGSAPGYTHWEGQLSAGALIDVRPASSVTATGTAVINIFSGYKVNGSNAVQAPPTVAFDYYGSTQTITTSAAPLIEPTKQNDSMGLYNTTTGLFPSPYTGTYHCDCRVSITSLAEIITGQFYVGGSASGPTAAVSVPASTTTGLSFADDLFVLAGQSIGCYVNTATSSSLTTGNSSFSCHRVGY